jgi:hypothetical protein
MGVSAISTKNGSGQGNALFIFNAPNNIPAAPFFDPQGKIVYVNTYLTGLRIFRFTVAQGVATLTPEASVTPATRVFAQTNPGPTSGPQVVTISSIGNAPLILTSLALSPTAGAFLSSDTCMSNPVLQSGNSCTVLITYAP